MIKRVFFLLVAGSLVASLVACNLPSVKTEPTALVPGLPTATATVVPPTPVPPSPTPLLPTATLVLPSPTVQAMVPTTTPVPAATGQVVVPGAASGPYAVILVASNDVLNIRSGPGPGYSVVGSFSPTSITVMRTGNSGQYGDALWVEVLNPAGGMGWVNNRYLTSYVDPTNFCADTRVNTLLANLTAALNSGMGNQLGPLASPVHGVDVRLYRYGNSIVYDQVHFQWVFDSTYAHNWGAAPGSGLDTMGSFHVSVLPELLKVFNAPPSITCRDTNKTGAILEPWPLEYTNVNFYSIHKPGTPGVDLDWSTWLVGVEVVNGQPYVFSLIHYQWEP